MKGVLISTIIALMAINLGLYAQEDKTQGDFRIRLELVYKKRLAEMIDPEGFPSPEIRQILELNDIPQEDKDWLLNSLRIEIARREKILHTNDGRAIKLPEDLKSITTSKNLKFMIVYALHFDYGGLTREEVKELRDEWLVAYKIYHQWQRQYEAATMDNKKAYKDSMYYWLKVKDDLERRLSNIDGNTKEYEKLIFMETESGKALWEKEGSINTFTGKGEDIFPPSYISNDGKTIIAVPGVGAYKHLYKSVLFYDEKGVEKKKVGGLFGRKGCHDLSPNGEMFFTLIQINRNDTKAGAVAAYDKNGNEVWITEIPGYSPPYSPCIAVSPNHKYIAASIWGTSLISSKGIVTKTYNCRTYKPGFSIDDKYVIIGNPKDTVYFIQTDNGEVLWKKYLGGQPYSRPFVAKDGCAIFYTDGYLLDKSGDIIWQGTNELKGAVGLSPSGHFFIPSSDPELIIYRIYSEVPDEDQ